MTGKSINLNGVRVYIGRLQNHGLVHFSSSEMNGVSQTFPYFHNSALNYAISGMENFISTGTVPAYALDWEGEFMRFPVYVLPAHPLHQPQYQLLNKATVDDVHMTPNCIERINSPSLMMVSYLDTYCQPRGGFWTAAFVFEPDFNLPAVFRLGKRDTPIRAKWKLVENPVVFFSEDAVSVSHLVNPLDVAGDFQEGIPIAMPPHFLMNQVVIANDYFLQYNEKGSIHIPQIVLKRIHLL